MQTRNRMTPPAGTFSHAPDYAVVAILEIGPPPESEIIISGYAVLDRSTGEFKSKIFSSKAEALKRLAELDAELKMS
jgi:hypothetical protein